MGGHKKNKLNPEILKIRQSLDLEQKILLSKRRIIEYYNYYSGNCYISFSGGRDSTVLLHLIRSIYPDLAGIYAKEIQFSHVNLK